MLHWYNNMTSDYKENLIEWLTGNFETTPSNNTIQQTGNTTTQNILKDYLQANYSTTNCVVTKTVKSTVNGNTLVLLYDNDNSRSLIIIFDENLTPIQLITTYASGTQFKRIMCINVGEDGNFFLLENTGTAIRFVMCNNITAGDVNGDYKVVLRKAYNVGGNLVNLINIFEVVKYPNQSKYLVVGSDTDQDPRINIVTEIVVQVGIGNEYNDFTFDNTNVIIYGDLYYNVINDEISFKICGTYSAWYYELVNNGYSITRNTYDMSWGSLTFNNKVVKINSNDAYIISYALGTGGYSIYHFNGSSFELLAEEGQGETFNIIRSRLLNINKINGIVYGILVRDYATNQSCVRGFTIINNKYSARLLSEGIDNSNFSDANVIIATNNSYDLYNFTYAFGNLTTKSYLIYNSSRYNGYGYIDYNYFIPSYGLIKVNNNPVFARGLYNFTILNNSSTAVINIPNSYINNVQFVSSLYGQTNKELIVDSTAREKNIYENVLLNFNNSINITNDNIYMATPSARLNNSILNNLDYNNSKLGYVRINYVSHIEEFSIDITKVSNFVYTVNFSIMAGEDINSIMLISEDKQTIYDQFIIDYEIGTIYNIQRTIEIGG